MAGGNANRATDTLERATEAFARGRERDALRMLRPLVDAYPKAAAVRELAGLCRYRIGSYPAAADDLAAFADLTGSTEQHPVLMDCRRAQGRLKDVEDLWEELRETSPSAALVTEGRIVLAGALADAGRLSDAIDLLERRAQSGRIHEHIVRLWYALADLEERAGDVPRGALFEQVRFDSGLRRRRGAPRRTVVAAVERTLDRGAPRAPRAAADRVGDPPRARRSRSPMRSTASPHGPVAMLVAPSR